MKRTILDELAKSRAVPSVTLLCPLDTRRPGNTRDPIELRELRDRAATSLDTASDRRTADALVARIDGALDAIDLEHPKSAIAVLVSPEISRVLELDAPVNPQVTVGNRFAMRDLIAAMSHPMRGRVLALSLAKARCIDFHGAHAIERLDFGFPVVVRPPTEADTPHKDFPLDEHEHAEAAKFVFRVVDRALRELEQHDQRRLVLVGAERDLAYFDEVAVARPQIIGRVHGNYERCTADELAGLAQPTLEAHTRHLQQRACDEVRDAIGSHAVAGIADVWQAALVGRGQQLVVEAEYRDVGRRGDDRLVAAELGDVDVVDTVDDTIAEVIRHGGDVMVVPTGSLADLGHIALLTRY